MTAQDKTYNGWQNYETWNAALWIDNDQGTQEFWQEKAQDAYDSAESDRYNTREEAAVNTLREALKEQFEEDMPELGASFWSDILSAALSEVNWHEIAEGMIEECDKDPGAEDESAD